MSEQDYDDSPIDEWSELEDPPLEPGGCPVGYIPHPLGSDPEGCLVCRDHRKDQGR
jgi:hypothetical protein